LYLVRLRGVYVDILNEIIKNLEQGNYALALIVVMIFLVIKSKNIYIFYKDFKQHKIKKFKEFTTENNLDEDIKKISIDFLNNEIFYQITGINAEKNLRKKIIEIYEKNQGKFSYKDLKIAQRFLILEGDKLAIKITYWDTIEMWFNITLSMILMIIASYFISLPSMINSLALFNILISISFGIFTYLFAGFVIAQTFPIRKAKKLANILNLTNQRDCELSPLNP